MPAPLPYLNFGPHGTFTASGGVQTTPADIDALAAYLREQASKKLVLHFHGGLVSQADGILIADKMKPVYAAAGAVPITIVWETGLLEVFRDNIKTVHQTELFQKILIWVLKKAASRLGIGIDSKGVGVDMPDAAIKAELTKDAPFESLAVGAGARGGAGPINEKSLRAIETGVAAELEGEIDTAFLTLAAQPEQNAQVRAAMTERGVGGKSVLSALQAAWAIAKIVTKVIRRFLHKTDHGFYPTVVEEIFREYYIADLGGWVWNNMKDSADQMWLSNSGVVGDARHAGRYLLEALAPVQRDTGLIIDLVGHSAGSIAICRLLETAAVDFAGLKFRNVVFLAPAVRSDLFREVMANHPERYGSLRIFTMRDALECEDRLVNGLYTRSLLYFISGVLEASDDVPLLGMERYLSGAAPYNTAGLDAVRAFVSGPNRLVLSKAAASAGQGFQTAAASHGDFDDDAATCGSLTCICSQQ